MSTALTPRTFAAVTPTAQRVANGTEWLWFDPVDAVAIWRGPGWLHGFSADSLAEALERVRRDRMD